MFHCDWSISTIGVAGKLPATAGWQPALPRKQRRRSLEISQRVNYSVLQKPRTRSAESLIHRFEPANQVDNFPPRIWPAGGRTEVGAAAERTRIIDEAVSRFGLEQRTAAIWVYG